MLDVNLNLYKTFYEVARTKSLTVASDNLFITPPAVSKKIKPISIFTLDIRLYISFIFNFSF